MFFRHPMVYVEAFVAHVQGWFNPGMSNSIRYIGDAYFLDRQELFPGVKEKLITFYEWLNGIPILGLLENVGMHTWLLFCVSSFMCREKKHIFVIVIPLYVSLLICIFSPVFFMHPRYAFPIMFSIPFIIGMACTRNDKLIE